MLLYVSENARASQQRINFNIFDFRRTGRASAPSTRSRNCFWLDTLALAYQFGALLGPASRVKVGATVAHDTVNDLELSVS